ncbi:MAG: MoaD/ThiS family protein [Chloroflexi bacterium]|nr:MoaD/ThiS family protein [Chloroflexota bacterium]
MRIRLTSNVDLGLGSIQLAKGTSLRALLMELSSKVRDLTLIDPKTSDLDDFFVVSVNGQEVPFLPERLETMLKDGDEVQVAIVSFGGGER